MADQIDRLYIIDTTSPFFVRKIRKIVNWSKIPYDIIEKKGIIRKKDYRKIRSNFETYVERVADMGYNAVSVDQLCYLVNFDMYTKKTRKKIDRYRSYFTRLFAIARKRGLRIFVNSDVIFTNSRIESFTGRRFGRYIELLKQAIEALFHDYPEAGGVIIRVGESDGVDVKGSFRSRIIVKTPRQLNTLIKALLPTFEELGKLLVVRTWTVGAYPIGDMMWNPATYDAAFGDIDSDHLIISMKYGDTDFFRYLELNGLLFHGHHRKLLELQTRREYEGFGEYPSFTGRDYRRIYEQIGDSGTFAGIHVWCQTGGWSRFRNITFFKDTSWWNELNTAVTLSIFRDGATVEDAVAAFAGRKRLGALMEFLRLSDEAIRTVLYDPEIASRELYFNGIRIPPLAHVFWDYVTVTEHIVTFCNLFAENGARSVEAAAQGLECVRAMGDIGKKLDLPYDHEFHYDTFELLYLCRRMIYGDGDGAAYEEFTVKLAQYRERHPGTYRFRVSTGRPAGGRFMRFILRTFIREGKQYRTIDRFLFGPLTPMLFRLWFRLTRKKFPAFIDKQAMPLEKLLK